MPRCSDVRLAPCHVSVLTSIGHYPRGRFSWCPTRLGEAFTLLEVMVAVAFIGFAMLALLSLHHTGMQSVARARELTQASMLAEGLMTDAEQARFPEVGRLAGNFQKKYPGEYVKFRWQRVVEQSQEFPDVRRVRIIVFYGPRFRRSFAVTEFMHNPTALTVPAGQPQPNGAAGKPKGAASGGGD
ncbi:MAG: hypothetical protein JO166_12820 [Deltaproteobacteria bacterium]|nr:hypothetical protein [Deltaproteobacteria bacterium]